MSDLKLTPTEAKCLREMSESGYQRHGYGFMPRTCEKLHDRGLAERRATSLGSRFFLTALGRKAVEEMGVRR